MRPVINTEKHYVHKTLSTVLAGATDNIVIVAASAVPGGTATAVREGAVIKAVFIEMWVRTNDTSPGATSITLYKKTGGDTSMTATEAADLNSYDNKKNVLYHTQGLINDQDSSAIPFIRQWFKIPKGKQRFGLADVLILNVFAQALDNNICGFFTYKEQY